jgi:hypothetical protein
MIRVFALGVASVVLMACQPAAEPAAPAVTAAPVVPAEAAAPATPAAPAVEPIVALEAKAATCLRLIEAAEAAGKSVEEDDPALQAANCQALLAEGEALLAADPSLRPRLDAALEPIF